MLPNNFCRVCWLDLWYPIWWDDWKSPSFDICPCCGTEFWYQDCLINAIRKQRDLWLLEKNGEWHHPKEKPANWDLEKQKHQIPKEFL